MKLLRPKTNVSETHTPPTSNRPRKAWGISVSLSLFCFLLCGPFLHLVLGRPRRPLADGLESYQAGELHWPLGIPKSWPFIRLNQQAPSCLTWDLIHSFRESLRLEDDLTLTIFFVIDVFLAKCSMRKPRFLHLVQREQRCWLPATKKASFCFIILE